MIELIMEIFGLVMFLFSLFSLIKYIVLSKMHPNSLKTFAISVIAFFMFAVFFSIAETALFYKVRYKKRIDGVWAFYIVISIIYLLNVLTLYRIASYRLILNEDHFIYYNIFGIKKRYCYKDITNFEIDIKNGYYKIYIGKRKVEVPYFIEDQNKVLDYIKPQNK